MCDVMGGPLEWAPSSIPLLHPAGSPLTHVDATNTTQEPQTLQTSKTAHHHIPRRFLSKDPARKAIRNFIQAPISSHHPKSPHPKLHHLPTPNVNIPSIPRRIPYTRREAAQHQPQLHGITNTQSASRFNLPSNGAEDHPTPHASPIAAATSRELRVLPRLHSQSPGLVEASFV